MPFTKCILLNRLSLDVRLWILRLTCIWLQDVKSKMRYRKKNLRVVAVNHQWVTSTTVVMHSMDIPMKVSKLCLDFTFFILTMAHDERKHCNWGFFSAKHTEWSWSLMMEIEWKNDRNVMQKLAIVESSEKWDLKRNWRKIDEVYAFPGGKLSKILGGKYEIGRFNFKDSKRRNVSVIIDGIFLFLKRCFPS